MRETHRDAGCGHRSLRFRSWCCTSRMSRLFHSPVHVSAPVTHPCACLSGPLSSVSARRAGTCEGERECERSRGVLGGGFGGVAGAEKSAGDTTPCLKSTERLLLRGLVALLGAMKAETRGLCGCVGVRRVAYGCARDFGCLNGAEGGERRTGAGGGSTGEVRWVRMARRGAMSSAGTFSPRVRLSFASRLRRVSVAVGVEGVWGVVGVKGNAEAEGGAKVAVLSVAAVSGVMGWTRGSEGGSGTAFKRRTRGVGRGARLPLLLDFSRTWRAKDLGVGRVGREWVDMADSSLSRLERERAREDAEELAEDEA